MKRSRGWSILAAVAIAVGLLGSATYGAVQLANAAGTGTTYYACLSTKGALSKVGTTSPTTCAKTAAVISWNSVGPQGPQGPQGAVGPQGPTGPQGPAGTTAFGSGTQIARSGNGETCTLGEVILTAGAVANGIPAVGQLLPISSNAALFSLMGTTYGGNGTTDFELPDLTAAAPNGLTYSICDVGVYPSSS